MNKVVVFIHVDGTMEVFDYASTLCDKYNYNIHTIRDNLRKKGSYRKDGLRIEKLKIQRK